MKDLKQNLQKHKSRFLEIMDCKDKRIRNLRLESLETDMENTYDIPRVGATSINAFSTSPDYSAIYRLYLQVKNARWVM